MALRRHPTPTFEVSMRVLTVVGCITILATSSAAQGSPAPQDIRARIGALETAFNKRDAAGMLALYAPDGDFAATDGPLNAGSVALQKGIRDQMATMQKGLQIGITVTNVRFLTADVAIANARAHFNLPDVKDDRGTYVFVHKDGKWLIAALRVLPAQKQ